jgi:hypothetical protein
VERVNDDDNLYTLAEYIEQKISDYAGNPLIEALPPILESEDDVIAEFYNLPFISDEEKCLSPRVKSHLLWRIKGMLQPLPIHIRLESMLSVLIRNSYTFRNPLDPQSKKKIQILSHLKTLDMCEINDVGMAYKGFNTTAECAIITGVSGAGKTTAVNRILQLYPQVIRHQVYKGKPLTRTQIVWLKVDCPFDGSIATLCRIIFKEIDKLTGERWLDKYGYCGAP